MAALTPVLSPVDGIGPGASGLFVSEAAAAPRLVGVATWEIVVGSAVPVVEDEAEDVDEDDMVEEEDADEIRTPCASIVESEMLNHALLARVDVAPCLNS